MTTRTEPAPQHAPTPWLWGPSAVKANHFDIIDEETESTLATVAAAEFAAKVVREHNTRAALVEALEKALLFMRNVPTDDQLDARLRNGVTGRDAVDAAELALAAAKGTP